MAGVNRSDVCVLIPAYNEEKNIAGVCKEVLALGFPLVVVDDGSKDATAERIKNLPLEFLSLGANRGKGASLRKGFEYCLGKGYSALILMDADGQHDPAELDLFVKALEEDRGDVVVGNRMHNPQGMPFIRVATNRFLSWVISSLAGQKVPDSQCGFRAIRRRVLESTRLSTHRFEIESEMLLLAARGGFRIHSIPIGSVYAGAKSKINPFRDTLRFFGFIFKYFFKKRDSF